MTPEEEAYWARISMRIGDGGGRVRAQQTWTDSVELSVSVGMSAASHRLFPDDCRKLAAWLNNAADEIEART